MIKRKFPMSTLNISQGRYMGMTHKNLNAIDICGGSTSVEPYYATTDLEVIGVYPIATTGFANTVHFYDKANDVTIALTHTDLLLPTHKVGHVFNDGDVCYYEGTCGQATGNHIHMEIAKGRIPSKTKYSYGWALADDNTVNIEDYFYVDDTIKVINDFGYHFQKGETMEILKGPSDPCINGHEYHLYRMQPGDKIGVLSAGINKVQEFSKFYVKGMVSKAAGSNYYQLRTDQPDPYGTTYGDISAPLNDVYLCFNNQTTTLYYDLNTGDYGDCTDIIINPLHDVFSPAVVYPKEGHYQYARMVGIDHVNVSSMYTFLIRFKDGTYALGITEKELTPKTIAEDFRPTRDMVDISFQDGGGSAQFFIGDTIRDTGRPVPSVLVIYKVVEDGTSGDDNDTDSDDNTGPGLTGVELKVLELEGKVNELYSILEKLKGVFGNE